MKHDPEFQERVDKEYLRLQYPFTDFKITEQMRKTKAYNDIALDMAIKDLKKQIETVFKDAAKALKKAFRKFI